MDNPSLHYEGLGADSDDQGAVVIAMNEPEFTAMTPAAHVPANGPNSSDVDPAIADAMKRILGLQ